MLSVLDGMKSISAFQRLQPNQRNGFSLVEMIVSLSLGGLIFLLLLQAVIADSLRSSRALDLFRVKSSQKLALNLIELDLSYGGLIDDLSFKQEQSSCPLSGRTSVLTLETHVGVITYMVGPAPSKIWHGDVLMRCGPAYGLNGALQSSDYFQNRVVIDGLNCTNADCFGLDINGADHIGKLSITHFLSSDSRDQGLAVKTSRHVDLGRRY